MSGFTKVVRDFDKKLSLRSNIFQIGCGFKGENYSLNDLAVVHFF